MSPMVLFEAVWLESFAKPVSWQRFWPLEAPGRMGLFCWALAWVWDPDSPEGPWERSWEALLEALGKAHLPARKKTRSRFGVLIKLRYRGGPVWPAPNECSRKGEHGL